MARGTKPADSLPLARPVLGPGNRAPHAQPAGRDQETKTRASPAVYDRNLFSEPGGSQTGKCDERTPRRLACAQTSHYLCSGLRGHEFNAAGYVLWICFRKGWAAVGQATAVANPHVRKFSESPHQTPQLGDQTGGAMEGVRGRMLPLDHQVAIGRPTRCCPPRLSNLIPQQRTTSVTKYIKPSHSQTLHDDNLGVRTYHRPTEV